MSVQEVDRSKWTAFFDTMTRSLAGKTVELEVASLDIGDQIQAEWVPLIGITYDHKNNLIGVVLAGIEHLVRVPREVYANYCDGRLVTLAIVDAEGTKQILKLKDPLALPAPPKALEAQE